eukprot:TRINITY_DN1656_c0_g1_i1.p1 TRINITY_DN1656_c0_g1~~TRINITY_DN1656_c0_g1_i1.p1  ORF type:complete len:364 (+),score=87.74 TRINITY_DN1656_c0_g1_i1:26-1117(+)
MKLFAPLLLCSMLAATLSLGLGDQNIQDAYSVKITLAKVVGNALLFNDTSVFVKFFGENERLDSVNMTIDLSMYSIGLEYQFSQSQVLGTFASSRDITSSNAVGFHLYSNRTNELLGTFNLSAVLAANFPNTSEYNPLVLWPDHDVNVSCFSENGIQAIFWANYKGVVDVFGVDVHWPTWKVILVAAGVKLGACFLLAFLDWCCLPLERSSGWEKSKILFGNAIWLFFGGLSSGVFYLISGMILIVTILLSPFGLKLVRIGVFTLFPFGRVIKCDDQSEARELCSCVGNVLWFLLIGWIIVLVHLIAGIVLCILIITFPLALQHFKLAKIAFMPFGHSVALKDELVSDPFERAPLKSQRPGYV